MTYGMHPKWTLIYVLVLRVFAQLIDGMLGYYGTYMELFWPHCTTEQKY